jgi:hypothetical protein
MGQRRGEETLYEILGVSPTATAEELRAAYREQAARYHPDKYLGHPLQDLASERMAAVNRAYEILSDPARRARYDASLSTPGAPGRRRSPLRIALWAAVALGVGLVGLRLLAALLRAARGTPLAGVLVLALAVLAAVFWRRRRTRRR